MIKYSILVNTCDKFEDCWDPFFKLFSIYWPDYEGKIYLNTEYKDYSYGDLDIVAVKGCAMNDFPENKRATWSQCLQWALEVIETDTLLYMQEDYFLNDIVKHEWVNKYLDLMNKHDDIHCIHLTDQGSPAESMTGYETLYSVPLKHKDRVSCQAALWSKNALSEYICTWESAWSFEWYGSKRAEILPHNFYVVDKKIVKKGIFEILPYVFTGVIGGRWFNEVVPLFEKHGIDIDYSLRGFFERRPYTVKDIIISKIKRLPVEIRSSINLLWLTLQK